jgi:MFS family permease
MSSWVRLRVFDRKLTHYPDVLVRYRYLLVVVLATIVLYYQQYVGGSVSPSVLAYFGMTFRYYLTVVVISSVVGALSSLLAGLADRWGRANIVVFGLLTASLTTAFGIPNATSRTEYALFVSIVGFIEGMVLVATPALVRDFSPQLGRGRAMGIWTMGPVLGSLVVSEVASNTLPHLHAWQDQFRIAGLVGLGVFVVALIALRELSPALRDQLMISVRERVLVEARARRFDVASALRRPWRQMVTPSVIVSALGVSLFLLIYYAAVGFFVIYFTSVFGFSQSQANGLGNWFWAADAITVVVVGLLSDKVGVRKPFIAAGTIAAIAMTVVFASRATRPETTYDTFIVLISILSVSRGFAYAPWMAAFTETLERKNPALVATGLAVWGWVLRAVVAIAFLVIPYVVTSVSPVVDYGPRLLAIQSKYKTEVTTLHMIDPATRAALRANQHDVAAIGKALKEIETKAQVTPVAAVVKLLDVRKIPAADRDYLAAHGQEVLSARAKAPRQWEHWWWVCVGGQVVFLPTTLLLAGRWRRSSAKRDQEEHRRVIEKELAELGQDATPVAELRTSTARL